MLAAIKADMLPGTGPGCGDTPGQPGGTRACARPLASPAAHAAATRSAWRTQAATASGSSCPGDPNGPARLDQLGQARPYALWLRGHADLRFACSRSVSMVGSRAATSYGGHVAGEIAADLGERGWSSSRAERTASTPPRTAARWPRRRITIAVLACGVDYPYPAGHADLFAAIAAQGLVISEWPPGRHPARMRFLVRNRVIAALGCGTVIVEAGERSGALNTARHAATLGKPLMAVPGPVTSAQSAGCHRIIRDWGASCVTRAADIIEMAIAARRPRRAGARRPVTPAHGGGPGLRSRPSSDVRPEPCRADDLDPDSARVLDALPTRGGAGTSTIAVEAGVDLDTVLRCLGRLAGYGFIERCDRGWRLRRP